MNADFFVPNASEWIRIVPQVLQALGEKKVIALHGDLGAGKTTLVQSIYRHLTEVDDEVHSPTFSLVHHYPLSTTVDDRFTGLYHMDLYRLKSSDELLAIGLMEMLDENVLIIIEWPNLAIPLLDPTEYLELEILHKEQGRALIFKQIEHA